MRNHRIIRHLPQSIHAFVAKLVRSELRWIVLAGLSIRLVLAPITTWTDMTWFLLWNIRFIGNPSAILSYTFYPSPWFLTTNIFFRLFVGADLIDSVIYTPELSPLWRSSGLFFMIIGSPAANFAIKLPNIMADFILSFGASSIVKQISPVPHASKRVFAVLFLNPLLIFSGSVMGQNDAITAAFMTVALYFLVRENFLFAGLSLGLASIYKDYSILMLPIFLAVICASLLRKPRNRWKNWTTIAIFIAGILIPVVLLIPTLRLLGDVLFVRATAPALGGINFWGIVAFLPQTVSILTWAYTNFFALSSTLFWTAGIVVVITSLIWAKSSADLFTQIVMGFTMAFSLLLLLLPLTSPDYIIPLLPFLAISQAIYNRWNYHYWVLSIASLAFVVSLAGPLVFLIPLYRYAIPLSMPSLVQSTLGYISAPGLITSLLSNDLKTIFSTIAFVILLLLVWDSLYVLFSKNRSK